MRPAQSATAPDLGFSLGFGHTGRTRSGALKELIQGIAEAEDRDTDLVQAGEIQTVYVPVSSVTGWTLLIDPDPVTGQTSSWLCSTDLPSFSNLLRYEREPEYWWLSLPHVVSASQAVGAIANERQAAEESATNELIAAMRIAREERFEDGFESEFSRWLISWLHRKSDSGLLAVEEALASGHLTIEVIGEALRVVGRIRERSTHSRRLELLVKALGSTVPAIRDAALLGLEFMDDSAAVIHLRAAAEREPLRVLRQSMAQLAAQLES